MMKKRLMLLILVFCMICPIFVACKSSDDNNVNNGGNNTNIKSTASINISYMKDLAMDISGSTAFGIKKVATITAEPMSANCCSVSLLNSSVEPDSEVIEKNYLYTTTETYENGNVEYNNNSITKVTFKKNTAVQEDVYDSEGNLIDSDKIITQEEIPAQINKLYVSGKYIFMQFVALVSKSGNYNYYDNNELKTEYIELRPDALTYDENGISEFDLKNYYSSALSQSFVVDLANGNIYKITNFNIAFIHDVDVVKDSGGNYYKMTINDNRELVFTDIMPNKEVSINNVVSDKYGYTFVANSHISTIDSTNKIIYFVDTKYMISDNKEVYLMEYDTGTSMHHIEKVIINGNEQPYDNTRIVSGLKHIRQNIMQASLIGYYKGNRVYNGNLYADSGIRLIENAIYYRTSVSTDIKWLDDNFCSSTLLLTLNNKLYYKMVDIESCLNTSTILSESDFTKLSENSIEIYRNDYYIKVGANKMKIQNVYSEQTLSGTKYYKLTRLGSEMKLILLQDIEYSQSTYIFQPINK